MSTTDDFYTKPKAELLGMELSPSHEHMLEDARTEFPTAVFAAPETIRVGDWMLSCADYYPNLPPGPHRWIGVPITRMSYLLGMLDGSYTNGGVLIVRGTRSKWDKMHIIKLTEKDLEEIFPLGVHETQAMLDTRHGPGKYLVVEDE